VRPSSAFRVVGIEYTPNCQGSLAVVSSPITNMVSVEPGELPSVLKDFSARPISASQSSGCERDGSSMSIVRGVCRFRSGNTFSEYGLSDGVYWTQYGSTVTISMATNVYLGLAVAGNTTSSLATATFDNVSVSSTAAPAPVITGISPTTGSIGSQVVISGSGFGATQSSSTVLLNTLPVTINTWSNTSITITIPTGATSGHLTVTVAPSMNNSNPVEFEVTTQPLPSVWLDKDLGYVGVVGSATYSNGTFTVQAAGADIGGSADGMHFVYQPLSGDGTIVARVVSLAGGGASPKAGVMIRETLDPSSTNAYMFDFTSYATGQPQPAIEFSDRTTTAGGTNLIAYTNYVARPNWVKVVRSGNTFSAYSSADGVYWSPEGSTVTVTMATNVYVGLAVSANTTTSLVTATFDSVSVSSTATPGPAITGTSATTASIGSPVTIFGSGFGAAQGGSAVLLNGVPAPIVSWSDASIIITIPTGAVSGYLMVTVAPSMNDSNPVFIEVTTEPLPSVWLDRDVGAVGVVGSATYSGGTFTVLAGGADIGGTADATGRVAQPLRRFCFSGRVAHPLRRVARALSLNFGCPVLDGFSRAGLLTCFSRPASGHGIDANQTGFLLRVK
jgi:IPT/TIG domain